MITPSSVVAVTLSEAGTTLGFDNQRVVTRCLERIRQTGEHAFAVVADPARLAMHDRWRAHDPSAEHLADALMAEAHAEDRSRRAELLDDCVGDAGFVGVARSGRDQDAVGVARRQLVDGDLVVTEHDRLRAQLTEVLHEVVNEAVVVVDHDNARGHPED